MRANMCIAFWSAASRCCTAGGVSEVRLCGSVPQAAAHSHKLHAADMMLVKLVHVQRKNPNPHHRIVAGPGDRRIRKELTQTRCGHRSEATRLAGCGSPLTGRLFLWSSTFIHVTDCDLKSPDNTHTSLCHDEQVCQRSCDTAENLKATQPCRTNRSSQTDPGNQVNLPPEVADGAVLGDDI